MPRTEGGGVPVSRHSEKLLCPLAGAPITHKLDSLKQQNEPLTKMSEAKSANPDASMARLHLRYKPSLTLFSEKG